MVVFTGLYGKYLGQVQLLGSRVRYKVLTSVVGSLFFTFKQMFPFYIYASVIYLLVRESNSTSYFK